MFANQVVGISLVLRCGGLGAKLNGLRRHGNCLVGSNMISHTPVIKSYSSCRSDGHNTSDWRRNSTPRFWRKLMAAWIP